MWTAQDTPGSSTSELNPTEEAGMEEEKSGTAQDTPGSSTSELNPTDESPHPNISSTKDVLFHGNKSAFDKKSFRWVLEAIKAAEQEEQDVVPLIRETSPLLPKGGELILYKKKHPKDDGFLDDGYHRFDLKGRKTVHNKGLVKTYYELVTPHSKLRAEESHPLTFQRHTYWLATPITPENPIVLIHYVGDETSYVPVPHGNSRTNDRPYRRTSKNVKDQIKGKVADKYSKPKMVYEGLIENHWEVKNDGEAAERGSAFEAINTPRDVQQIKNFKAAVTRQQKISDCEIMSVYEMGKQDLGQCIRLMQLIPDHVVVVAEETILNLTNHLLTMAKKDRTTPQLVCYDTTFNLGDFYVSAVVAKNTLLENNPLFPVALMIHDRKTSEVHSAMWRTLNRYVSLQSLAYNVPICMDREKALKSSLLNVVPGANVVHCNRHIRDDVKLWIGKAQGRRPEDTKILTQQVDYLLECESEVEFIDTYKKFRQKWSSDFREYMDVNLFEDMKLSSKFFTNQFPAFQSVTPTNNLSESFNFVMKYWNDWKELQHDQFILNFFHMQCKYISEFERGENNLGNHKLKNGQNRFLTTLADIPNYIHMSEQKIKSLLKSQINQDSQVRAPLAKEEIARDIISFNFVNAISGINAYTVVNPYSSMVYTVSFAVPATSKCNKLYKCTCGNPNSCVHVMAVKMFTKEYKGDEGSKTKLNVLRVHSRGHKNRLGRKKPNITDLLDGVEEANDSILRGTRTQTCDVKESSDINFTPPFGEMKSKLQPRSGTLSQDKKRMNITTNNSTGGKRRKTEIGKQEEAPLEKQETSCPINIKEISRDTLPISPFITVSVATMQMYEEFKSKCKDFVTSEKFQTKMDLVTPHTALTGDGELDFIDVEADHLNDSSMDGKDLMDNQEQEMDRDIYSLMPKRWVTDKVIDGFIEEMIRQNEKIRFGYIPCPILATVSPEGDLEMKKHILQYAALNRLINDDLVLVPLNASGHWMLGVITFGLQTIFIIDPYFPNHINDPAPRNEEFVTLLKTARAIYFAAGMQFCTSDWKLVYATDGPIQIDTHECGVILCLNAFSLIQKKRWPTSEEVDAKNSDMNRAWILEHYLTATKQKVKCTEGQGLRKEVRDTFAEWMNTIQISEILPVKEISLRNLFFEIRKHHEWSICYAKDCDQTENEISNEENVTFICIHCRLLFHKFCSEIPMPSNGYFICKTCQALNVTI